MAKPQTLNSTANSLLNNPKFLGPISISSRDDAHFSISGQNHLLIEIEDSRNTTGIYFKNTLNHIIINVNFKNLLSQLTRILQAVFRRLMFLFQKLKKWALSLELNEIGPRNLSLFDRAWTLESRARGCATTLRTPCIFPFV